MKPGARDSTDTGVSSSRGTLVSPGGSFRAANGNIIGLRYMNILFVYTSVWRKGLCVWVKCFILTYIYIHSVTDGWFGLRSLDV